MFSEKKAKDILCLSDAEQKADLGFAPTVKLTWIHLFKSKTGKKSITEQEGADADAVIPTARIAITLLVMQ